MRMAPLLRNSLEIRKCMSEAYGAMQPLKCHPSLKDRTLVRGKFSSSPSPASYDGEMTLGAFLQTPRSGGTTSCGWSGFLPPASFPSHGTLGAPYLLRESNPRWGRVRPNESWENSSAAFYFWLGNYPLSSHLESHGPASGHLAKSSNPPTTPQKPKGSSYTGIIKNVFSVFLYKLVLSKPSQAHYHPRNLLLQHDEPLTHWEWWVPAASYPIFN